MKNIISLLTHPLAISDKGKMALKYILLNTLKGSDRDSQLLGIDEKDLKVQFYKTADIKSFMPYLDGNDSAEQLDENSVMVIEFGGVIYPWTTRYLRELVEMANKEEKINAMVLVMNTPGGSANGVDATSSIISNSDKPIFVQVDGVCASAGMYLACGADKVYATSRTDVFGSIGTMTTFVDDTKFWKDLGFTIKDIYATDSTKKNNSYREGLEDNFEPIIKDLDYINKIFHETISKNFNIPIDAESDVFNGADYYAERAIELKICDGIQSLESTIKEAMIAGMKRKATYL